MELVFKLATACLAFICYDFLFMLNMEYSWIGLLLSAPY